MKKNAIIGAGISGRFVANLFKENLDYQVVIYEKNTSINLDEGYGIQLSTNSIKLLNTIGFNALESKDRFNPEKIDFTGLLIGGNYSIVQPISSDGNDYLLVNGAQITPTLYSTDGQQVSTPIPSDAIGNRAFGAEIVEFNFARYLIFCYLGSEGGDTRDAGVLIYDISGGTLVESLNAINKDSVDSKLIYTNSYGQNLNGNQAGDVKTFVDSAGENLYILSGATNNGFRVLKASKSK